MVTWSQIPSNQRNGDVTSYTVSYQLEAGPAFTKDVDAATRYVNLTELHVHTNYIIRVSANSEIGAGPQSDAIVVTTADSSEPLELQSSRSL